MNAQKFIADPFTSLTGKTVYATGDLGKILPDHEIQCLGRKDHQVKIRGYRIELEEIEQCLLSVPGVKQTLVMAREDQPGIKRLVAYMITGDRFRDQDSNSVVENCRSVVKGKLPSYMCPNDFVFLKSFPHTPNGKMDKKAFPPPELAGASTPESSATELTEKETLVMQIWQEVLQTKRIRLDDDFFELGGHSMTAVQMITKLEKQLALRLPLAIFLEYSSVRELAAFLDNHQKIGISPAYHAASFK